MKQNPTNTTLSSTEQLLKQHLVNAAEPDRPLSWQEVAAQLPPERQPRRRQWRWPLWFAPLAAAAAVAWVMVLQPQPTLQHAPDMTPMLLASNYSLDAVDQQIQQAYLKGADEAEIAILWQRRAELTAQETQS
ncbi:hypothetical protein [Pseudidiomarina insulisalsae]|uniref:Uncharacterized protein n=1 Tax=Pseudidiomarina insulisalsae TaxID=575789 RepID=A0A432YM93_9GAMM|nr:hypothetical protein [Pseudidiomarina insulisalsae]RUO62109.1 hypothetical protein CWI71_04455 [Pseudidiomarina insulisalsae]